MIHTRLKKIRILYDVDYTSKGNDGEIYIPNQEIVSKRGGLMDKVREYFANLMK